MSRFGALAGGAAFGATLFLVGFVLGTVRVLLIAPRTGVLLAVAIEVPVMLGLAWVIAPRFMRRLAAGAAGAAAGATWFLAAFGVLLALEWALGILVFGQRAAEVLASYGTPEGALGLVGQAAATLLPLARAGGADPAEGRHARTADDPARADR